MLVDLVFAIVVAMLAALILARVLGRRGPGPAGGALLFVFLFTFGVWAIGGWTRPFGPALWGIHWMPFLWAGLLLLLLLAALLPAPHSRAIPEPPDRPAEDDVAFAGGLYLIVLFVLFGAAILGMYW
jgi:hypothetical protein